MLCSAVTLAALVSGPPGGHLESVAAAAELSSLSGAPVVDSTITVTNESGTDELDKWGNEEDNWYHCGDYHKIVTPNGVMSAYPYGTPDWDTAFGYSGWTSEADPGRPKQAIYGVSYDVRGGNLKIRFANLATTQSFNKIRFDCTSVYPYQQTQNITVQPPTEITSTAATMHASVDFLRASQVCLWRGFVEYGSGTGSYERIAAVPYEQVTSNHLALPSRLVGLNPGTTYHYRFVFDQGDCATDPPTFWRSYSSPSNSFTTAVSPQAGRAYGISSFADGRAFIDVPGSRSTIGLNLWLYEGNGTSAQRWSLVNSRARDGYFKIVSEVNDLCLEIRGGSFPDAPIDQYTCDVNAPDQPNQLWQPVQQADGSFLLKSKGGLLLSSAGGTANATGLVARTATAGPTATQKWSFVPVSAAPTCAGQQPTLVAGPGSQRLITAGPDVFLGTPNADVIDGRGGDDLICGRGGDDHVRGGWGDDHLFGGHGTDRLFGGRGRDRLSGGEGNDRLSDTSGSDPLERGRGGSHITSGPGSDRITTTGGWYDLVQCNSGHDRVAADLLDRLMRCERARLVHRTRPR